ncbi:MAG: NlpC/P60 family protein [Actinomycetota bacterium]|nr:NlpC/P60 family protein [Actinomycetota bacterium]
MDQTRDGGAWVKLGNYAMRAGDDYVVRVSPEGGQGEVIADAVALVRGVTSPPPKGLAPAEGGQTYSTTATSFGENLYTASSTLRSRRFALVRYGRTHIGTPYYPSPPNPCRAYKKEDCSCFTKLVFRHFNKYLPDSPTKQYKYGKMIHHKSNLARGDLVFFKENGPDHPITHVAMYSGNGYVLHASAYYAYRKVVESKMRYITGYYGAKRIHIS